MALDDLEGLHVVYGDPLAMAWIPSGPSADLAASRARIERQMQHQSLHGFALWTVIERASGRILGDTGLLLVAFKGPEVELIYRHGRHAWGHGFAREAAAACLQFGLDELGLDRIIAITRPDHVRSRHVMETIGMRLEGERHLYGIDVVQYSATAL